MTQPRADIVELLIGFGDAYEKVISDPLIQIWNSVLGDLSPEEVAFGAKLYLRGPTCAFFPKPGQIYQLARPPVDYETEATLIVDEIFALTWCGANDGDRAKKSLSERAWAYIEQRGGWYKFASEMQQGGINLDILKSQMRKGVMGMQQRQTNATLALENKEVSLKSLGITMKSLAHDPE